MFVNAWRNAATTAPEGRARPQATGASSVVAREAVRPSSASRASVSAGAHRNNADVWNQARDTFDKWAATEFQPVRLIGVTATRLTSDGEQLDLFNAPDKERQRRLDGALDRINARFGNRSIHRGGATE